MARDTFEQIADALRGFLPGALREFHHNVGSRNLKVWYGSWHEHYEVQLISATYARRFRRAGTGDVVEVGFHCEHPRPDENDEALALCTPRVRTKLGPEAEAGAFIGPRQMRDRWRRVSEVWVDVDHADDGTIIEAAERLGFYIKTMEPILKRAPGSCACWKQ